MKDKSWLWGVGAAVFVIAIGLEVIALWDAVNETQPPRPDFAHAQVDAVVAVALALIAIAARPR